MSTKDRPGPSRLANSEESLVGRAHHALRAYVKAFSDRSSHTSGSFTFIISADRKSAVITDPAGTTVLSQTIANLANEGSQVRLAFVALRDIKEKLESAKTGQGIYRYQLDLIDKTAALAAPDGHCLSRDELKQLLGSSYRTVMSTDPVADVLAALPSNDMTSIACWEPVGRPIAAALFSELSSAEEYGFIEASSQLRERAYRLGLIHRPSNK